MQEVGGSNPLVPILLAKRLSVSETKNHVVGFLTLEYPEEQAVEIQMLYVHPDFQKQGVGSDLMKEICRLKKEDSYNKLIVWTIKDGPSM